MKRPRIRRIAAGLTLAGIALIAVASPALAQEDEQPRRAKIESAVSVSGNVEIVKDQTIKGSVISLDGDVRVDGRVNDGVYVGEGDVVITGTVGGPVVVLQGDITVLGRVNDNVIALDGRANVLPDGVVNGDVKSSDQPRVSQGATVTGDVDKTDFSEIFGAIGFALLAYLWIAVTVSMLVIGVLLFALFPRAGAALTQVARDAKGKSAGWGAIIAVGVPVASLVAISSIVGAPLGLGVLVALGLFFCVGYVVSAAALGRMMVKKKSTLVAFLAGFGILRLIALIPGIGILAWILASAYGVGVLAVTAYRNGRDAPGAPQPTADAPTADAPTVAAPTAAAPTADAPAE